VPAGLVLQPDQREHLADAETARIETAEQRHDFSDRQLLGKLGLLKLNAEPRPQRQVVAMPAIAEHLDVTGIGHPEAFENLDRRGLAGAIRAEHAEAFPGADLQIEARDRSNVTVPFGQAAAA